MDAGELLKLLVVLLIVIVPAISQIMAKVREAQKPPAGPPPRAPRVPRAPRPAEESFKEEIEEFLRRAAEGGQAGRRPGPAEAKAPRAKPPAPPKPATPPTLQPVEAGSPQGPVVEHVAKHLDTSDFSRRTTQLGGEVAQADDKLDARVHQVFEHQLSQFDWRTAQEVEAAGEAARPAAMAISAASLVGLLSSPESLRQAVVLNEIFQRPEQRWG